MSAHRQTTVGFCHALRLQGWRCYERRSSFMAVHDALRLRHVASSDLTLYRECVKLQEAHPLLPPPPPSSEELLNLATGPSDLRVDTEEDLVRLAGGRFARSTSRLAEAMGQLVELRDRGWLLWRDSLRGFYWRADSRRLGVLVRACYFEQLPRECARLEASFKGPELEVAPYPLEEVVAPALKWRVKDF